MLRDLIIVGMGGLGRQVAEIACASHGGDASWRVLGYVDDKVADGPGPGGLKRLGSIAWLESQSDLSVVVAVGNPAVRWHVVRRLSAVAGLSLATLVHPAAIVGRRVRLGPGSVIYPGAIIDADVTIGACAIINKGVTIGHDTILGDCVTLAPGVNLGGAVSVGSGCDLGIGCATVQNITIGEWAIVGAGAAVIADIPPNVTAVGVPARVIKEREPGWQME